MMIWHRFPMEYQMDSHDCGPAALKMVVKYYGKYVSLQKLRDLCGITREGVSLKDISTGAEAVGLRSLAVRCTLEDIVERVPLPAIVFWNGNHFVVVYKTSRKHVYVADPMKGHVCYTHQEFLKGWIRKNEQKGVLLALEPTATFRDTREEARRQSRSFASILKYFMPYKQNFGQIGRAHV